MTFHSQDDKAKVPTGLTTVSKQHPCSCTWNIMSRCLIMILLWLLNTSWYPPWYQACQKQRSNTTQKMKFSIKDFLSKRDQIHRKLRIWSHLRKKSVMENFIFVQCNLFRCYIHRYQKCQAFNIICIRSFSRYDEGALAAWICNQFSSWQAWREKSNDSYYWWRSLWKPEIWKNYKLFNKVFCWKWSWP